MSEAENQQERASAIARREELAEIKRTQVALLKAIQAVEAELGEEFMPQGTYHGIKFD